MQTFNRICLHDYVLEDGEKTLTLMRGKEYTTSRDQDGEVTVFAAYWVRVPVSCFAGEIEFTPEGRSSDGDC